MLTTYNSTGAVITGSSTHNERVERMWRDLGKSVTSIYSSTFSLLEEDGILDPLNEVDMFCLHFTFMPRLNYSLRNFQTSRNLHSLSTEGNMSPQQLFVEGLNAAAAVNLDISHSTDSLPPVNLPPVPNRVEVPPNMYIPCDNLMSQLQSSFNPLITCSDFGRDIYCQVVHYVGNHLQSGCSNCES